MLKRLNDALPGLVIGIVLYGVIVQLAGVWFVKDKLGYSIGLWYGIAIAVGMAVNLAKVIYDAVSMDGGKSAQRRIIVKSVVRYLVVVILFFILGFFDFGNLFTALAGILGLKVSAYAQPLLLRVKNKFSGDNDATPEAELVKNE